MTVTVLALELALNERNRKFQPVQESAGYRFNEPTRLYLEYDGSTLEFQERTPITGEIIDVGVIDRGDRDVSMDEAA